MSEYKETLNLPQTDFPMRGNLPQREPAMLAFWEDQDIYGQLRTERAGKPRYVLHDGPPSVLICIAKKIPCCLPIPPDLLFELFQ